MQLKSKINLAAEMRRALAEQPAPLRKLLHARTNRVSSVPSGILYVFWHFLKACTAHLLEILDVDTLSVSDGSEENHRLEGCG